MNTNTANLLTVGAAIEIRSNRDGWAMLHVLRNGKRVVSTGFRSNKQSKHYLQSRIYDAQPGTHLGNALARAWQEYEGKAAKQEREELSNAIAIPMAVNARKASI